MAKGKSAKDDPPRDELTEEELRELKELERLAAVEVPPEPVQREAEPVYSTAREVAPLDPAIVPAGSNQPGVPAPSVAQMPTSDWPPVEPPPPPEADAESYSKEL